MLPARAASARVLWQEAQAHREPCPSHSPGPAGVSRGSALGWALCKCQAQGRHGDAGERNLRAPGPQGWGACEGGVSAVRAASRSFSVSEGLTQPDTPLSWEALADPDVWAHKTDLSLGWTEVSGLAPTPAHCDTGSAERPPQAGQQGRGGFRSPLDLCGFPFWVHICVTWAAWEVLLSGFPRGSQAGPGLVTAAPGHSSPTWDRAGHPRARWQTGH